MDKGLSTAVECLSGGKYTHEVLLFGSPHGDFRGFFHPHGGETEHIYTTLPDSKGLKGYRFSVTDAELLGYAQVDHNLWEAAAEAMMRVWTRGNSAPCIGLPKKIWNEMMRDASWGRVSDPHIDANAISVYRAVGSSSRPLGLMGR